MKKKSEIVTFKVDQSLLEAMQGIPNRSSFIRSAVLAALDSTCPLCAGTGILTPKQQGHWDGFRESHAVEECSDCHERHLVCSHEKAGNDRENDS
ncbi:MAG: CopG family transcriptional regulator [Candidatus Zixiibacteriota bacterium]|nr:MAG: CopG family transcriptional regulator [candidate division Zixibacteria bacterium]